MTTTTTFPLLALIAVALMLRTCAGSPAFPSARGEPGEIGQGGARGQGVRTERFAALPDDQRRFTSKQILQALSEIIQRDDCISDYQGWVDFGRRSTD